MSIPNTRDWRLVVTMGMGMDARVEVFNPAGECMAACRWLPTPLVAFRWGLSRLDELTNKPEAATGTAPRETD